MTLFYTPFFTNTVGINIDDIFYWSTTGDVLQCIQIIKSWVKRVLTCFSSPLVARHRQKYPKPNFDPLKASMRLRALHLCTWPCLLHHCSLVLYEFKTDGISDWSTLVMFFGFNDSMHPDHQKAWVQRGWPSGGVAETCRAGYWRLQKIIIMAHRSDSSRLRCIVAHLCSHYMQLQLLPHDLVVDGSHE